jgi:hypothetical protein
MKCSLWNRSDYSVLLIFIPNPSDKFDMLSFYSIDLESIILIFGIVPLAHCLWPVSIKCSLSEKQYWLKCWRWPISFIVLYSHLEIRCSTSALWYTYCLFITLLSHSTVFFTCWNTIWWAVLYHWYMEMGWRVLVFILWPHFLYKSSHLLFSLFIPVVPSFSDWLILLK